MGKRLSAIIAIVIVVVWVASFILEALDHSFEPPAGVQTAMMLLAGAAFGHAAFGKQNGGS